MCLGTDPPSCRFLLIHANAWNGNQEAAAEIGIFGSATSRPTRIPASGRPSTSGRTSRITLSTSTTLITTNDPVKIAEDYAMWQHLADGRVDLMLGRGNMAPVYPWFGQDIADGIEQAASYGDGYFANNTFWPKQHYIGLIDFYRQRYAHYGHGTPAQAIVGLGRAGVHAQELARRRPGSGLVGNRSRCGRDHRRAAA